MAKGKPLSVKLRDALTRHRRMHPWIAEDAVTAIMPVVRREIRLAVQRTERKLRSNR